MHRYCGFGRTSSPISDPGWYVQRFIANSIFQILPPGLSPAPKNTRPRRVGIEIPGPGETLGFSRARQRIRPRTGRSKWRTTSATLRVSR